MAIPFEESKKKFSNQQLARTMSLSNDTPTVMTASITEENFIYDKYNYKYYQNSYSDDKLSYVDINKNIIVDEQQQSVTQETNSQCIPFELDRYYDGVDLKTMTFNIHYVNSKDREGVSKPVNFCYSETKIRFGWLIDSNVTYIDGDIIFEIVASGVNEKNENYIWRTKPNGKINILKSLAGNGAVKPTQTWYTQFLTDFNNKVGEVQEYARASEASAERAEKAATDAKATANTLTQTVENTIKTNIENSLKNYYTADQIDTTLDGYYTKEETYDKKEVEDCIKENIDAMYINFDKDTKVLTLYDSKSEISHSIIDINGLANFDAEFDEESKTLNFYNKISEQNKTLIDSVPINIDGLAKFGVEYDVETGLLQFFNGETLIGNVTITSDPTDEWVAAYDVKIDGKIKAASDEVKSEVSSLSNEVTQIKTNVSNLDTDMTGVKSAITTMQNDIENFTSNVYDVTYNSEGDELENLFKLYENGEVKTQFVITGGSGAGIASTDLKIEKITQSPLTVIPTDKVNIEFNCTSTDSDGETYDCSYTWKLNNIVIASGTLIQGKNTFDATQYISLGTNKLVLTVTDTAGSLKVVTWTVQKVDVNITSIFNDRLYYEVGKAVSFTYTPYGAIDKTVHFILDGVELESVTTRVSGLSQSYTLPAQKHGAHLLECYITANINGMNIETDHIYKDIIWYDPTSDVPVIGCIYRYDYYGMVDVQQYSAIPITYVVYDPNTINPTINKIVDGVNVGNQIMDSNIDIWSYKSSDPGERTLVISCGKTSVTIKLNIEELDIDVEPITADLAFDFNPSGYSNNDIDNRLWHDRDVNMSVSDNFDWVNGGYQIDDNGDKYFCVKAGTFATINYQLFADDAKVNGKEFKVVFKTTNIKKRDTSFISCMNNNIGLDMKVENAQIYSSNNSLYSPYCEEDIIEFEFNINKSEDIPLVLTYEDGVGNRPMIYTSDASFWQPTPQPITIGCDNCDVHIYRMKAYTRSLSDSDILSNFIADARNADEMIERYNRNQIYDENSLLSPEVLAQKCPNLRVIMIDAPWFTNDKDNKVDDTIVRMIYKNGDAILDNWTCTGAKHSGQGTSSNEYGYSSRNIDLIMDGDSSLFTLGDGKTTSKTITLTRDSVPTDYLNVKVNVASSENANNAQMARRYNMYNPFVRAAKFNDSKVKDCMEFYNCVIFIRERDEDISTHREFQDTNYHFYSIGNVGDSKKTDDTRVNDKNDPKECVVEITDYNVALAEFPTGNADGSICSLNNWKAGNIAYDYLYAPYKYKEGKFKSFGSESYEFRYEMKGITEEQREVNINAWRDLYKFIVTSSNKEFYSKLKEYFVIDSALYYYLFTERYTMVDNRAKNSFWHRGKVYITESEALSLGEAAGAYIIDNTQASINDGYRWDLSFGYDFDTSLGIDNTGKLVLTYGKEDTDYYVDDDPSSAFIYRAAKSTFFCRLRDLFKSEMQGMFVNREDVNAWSATGLINQWDDAQKQFPEELWRLDIQRKYVRTYKGVSIDNSIAGEANPRFLTEMMNGRKRYQRRMFERNQELYMATKYFGKTATQDQIMMRFNNPETYVLKPNFTLYLTPYSNMYIGVKFGNVEAINFRAKAGVEYTIPYSLDTADITLIYGASFIQGIGDLSRCYVGDNDFSKASRLQRLVIGSGTNGYSNTYIKKIALGNNKLLEYLDIRNTAGLSDVVDLSQCGNLLELYAQGSGATGVIFANGGKIKKFYIPAVTSFTAKNLNYIEDYNIKSYNNLQTLIVEYTPLIDTLKIVNSSNKLQTIRLIDIDWSIPDTSILNRLLSMRGINNNGGETANPVLSGNVYVPVVKEQELLSYSNMWDDLNVSYGVLREQFEVKFVNDDGSVLEIQYVVKGENAVDPTTRLDNPLIPTKESSVEFDYTFSKWVYSAHPEAKPLEAVFENRVIKATYVASKRTYKIRYVSKGITEDVVMYESTGKFGDNVPYKGITPTYTSEESAYKFYLFNRWDKSGLLNGDFVDGVKIVRAVFDIFEYNTNAFNNKQLKDLSPVEIYAMNKLGLAKNVITDKDPYTITVGNDIDYDDIKTKLIVSDTVSFDGSNYIDTGIKLFNTDKNFTLAIDYEFLSGNSMGAVLVQCFDPNGSNGFKLSYSDNVDFSWGTTISQKITSQNKREMIIIRHKKGDNNLMIYNSSLDSDDVSVVELTRNKSSIGSNGVLVLGAANPEEGSYEDNAIGNINWCKLWYEDLGDEVCKDLAMWTHEKITLEAYGFNRYYLSDNPSKRCSFSLLASHLLDRNKKWGGNNNAGGWGSSTLKQSLNNRLYYAMPNQIRALLKQVKVPSSIGSMSTDVETYDCYIAIPSLVEAASTTNKVDAGKAPYVNEGLAISYMTQPISIKRAYRNGEYAAYWLRSPNASYSNYVWQINASGEAYGYQSPYYEAGVLIEISF